MEPMVITVAREFASGGSEIAQAAAQTLGVPLYNKELITMAATLDRVLPSPPARTSAAAAASLIYSLYMMAIRCRWPTRSTSCKATSSRSWRPRAPA